MTKITVIATWFGTRGQYVCDAGRAGCWYSDDGDNWTSLDGLPVDSPEFHAVSIRLEGGQRDGVTVG
jgi:hypothetical protein